MDQTLAFASVTLKISHRVIKEGEVIEIKVPVKFFDGDTIDAVKELLELTEDQTGRLIAFSQRMKLSDYVAEKIVL